MSVTNGEWTTMSAGFSFGLSTVTTDGVLSLASRIGTGSASFMRQLLFSASYYGAPARKMITGFLWIRRASRGMILGVRRCEMRNGRGAWPRKFWRILDVTVTIKLVKK
jgi:hypothetical protein